MILLGNKEAEDKMGQLIIRYRSDGSGESSEPQVSKPRMGSRMMSLLALSLAATGLTVTISTEEDNTYLRRDGINPIVGGSDPLSPIYNTSGRYAGSQENQAQATGGEE